MRQVVVMKGAVLVEHLMDATTDEEIITNQKSISP